MKGMILFESFYGNTRSVAEAIVAQLIADGHEATLVNLGETPKPNIEGDFIFVGCPTRFGNMTRKTRKFAKKFDKETWGSKPIAVFDTHNPLPPNADEKKKKYFEPGASGWLKILLESRGFNVPKQPLRCAVQDPNGPLLDGELDKAKLYAHQFVTSLR